MRNLVTWFFDHWWLPLFFIGAAVTWIVLTRRGQSPVAMVAVELAAIDAGRRAREAKVKDGAADAREQVLKEHAATVAQLGTKQRQQAEEYRHDPEALARFLVHAAHQ